MTDQLFSSLVTIAVAIVGVAILAVLVSRNSNTAGVIGAAGGAFSKSLATAVSPVTGGGYGTLGVTGGYGMGYN